MDKNGFLRSNGVNSKNIKFPYISSFTSFLYVRIKLINSNSYFITISSIPSNKVTIPNVIYIQCTKYTLNFVEKKKNTANVKMVSKIF